MVTAVTLVFAVGPKVSATNALVIQGEEMFVIDDYAGVKVLRGLSQQGWNYYSDNQRISWEKKVVIPDGVNVIVGNRVGNGLNLNAMSLADESVMNYTINLPYDITSVYIPSSVVEIGNDAFRDFSSLYNVTFGENSQLTTIGHRAFAHTNLNKFIIPAQVTTLGEGIFENCNQLYSIYVENPDLMEDLSLDEYYDLLSVYNVITIDNPEYFVVDEFGKLLDWADSDEVNDFFDELYNNNTPIVSVIIPDTVTDIDNNFFSGWPDLVSVVIPSSVEWIVPGAFDDCVNLVTVHCECDEEFAEDNWDIDWLGNATPKVVWNYKSVQLENNENGNTENLTETNMINEANKTGVVAAVAGTAGGAASLGTIGTILGVVISKKRKK